jgi:hypothetical protein
MYMATPAIARPSIKPMKIQTLPKRPAVRMAPQDGHLCLKGFRIRKEYANPKFRLQEGQCIRDLTFDMRGAQRQDAHGPE